MIVGGPHRCHAHHVVSVVVCVFKCVEPRTRHWLQSNSGQKCSALCHTLYDQGQEGQDLPCSQLLLVVLCSGQRSSLRIWEQESPIEQ